MSIESGRPYRNQKSERRTLQEQTEPTPAVPHIQVVEPPQTNEGHRSFDQQFAGQFGYPESPMNPPPAESKDTVVQFALTEGCSHGRCTFCTMYRRDEQPYKVKTFPDFRDHVDQTLQHIRQEQPEALHDISRIFVGAGNALSVENRTLLLASQYVLKQLYHATGEVPRRLAVYGNTNDILQHGVKEMQELYCGGTCSSVCSINRLGKRRGVDVVYWGIESGNDAVLKLAGKGYTGKDTLDAGKVINYARVKPSVMIMPGLGGVEHSEGHIRDTVTLLNRIRPPWVTFMGLSIHEETPYAKWMKHEESAGRNRRMTPDEITEQTARMIEGLDFKTKIARNQVLYVENNPVSLNEAGSIEIFNRYEAQQAAARLRRS